MSIVIRPLRESDLTAARTIYRESFNAVAKVSDAAMGDADLLGTRFRAGYPAFAAEFNGELVGSVVTCPRGSVTVPGPVSVRTKGWTGNAGSTLMDLALRHSDQRGANLIVAFTFPSPRHLDLHRKHGMWPRFLTASMGLSVPRSGPQAAAEELFSSLSESDQQAAIADARALTDAIYPGFDWTEELRAVQRLNLGDTVLLREGSRLRAFAICHLGPESEGGTSTAYIKFAAVAPDVPGELWLNRLLDSVIALARTRSLNRVFAAVNTARQEAYRLMLGRGFQTLFLGVSMVRPDVEAYMRPGVFVLDDGR